MQAFKTRWFAKWASSQLLTDDALTRAIEAGELIEVENDG